MPQRLALRNRRLALSRQQRCRADEDEVPTNGYAPASKKALAFTSADPAEATTCLLLHGVGTIGWMWRRLVEDLSVEHHVREPPDQRRQPTRQVPVHKYWCGLERRALPSAAGCFTWSVERVH